MADSNDFDLMGDDQDSLSTPPPNQEEQPPSHQTASSNAAVPKPKRLACMICRKRKLKCDGSRPSCSTCSRLGHACSYDEQRRKSGPKRGYVKALEERLKQVETLLKSQETPSNMANYQLGAAQMPPLPDGAVNVNPQLTTASNMPASNTPNGAAPGHDPERWPLNGDSPQAANLDNFNFNANLGVPTCDNTANQFTWEMIGLGLEEPLPSQETINELHQIYFEKVHPSIPMVHKYRYLAAMNLAPNQRPPVCLRYAMWTMACSVVDKYSDLKDLFYARARKYVEADYVKGYGEHIISVAHCQAHTLLASYEMRMMYFPRAWVSTGSAVRLSQMIALHRLDGQGLEVKQCIAPPKDWTEREERRRTFWAAFCADRYVSIGTGWPMTIDERDIMTNLPSSEEAFEMSRPQQTQSLQECIQVEGATARLTPFGGVVLMAALFGRNLVHLHRPDEKDQDHDMDSPFWTRHREMDGILLNVTMSMPPHLRLPAGRGNPNVIFTNMAIHTSTICLHQAAIFKAEKNKLPASLASESKERCITAATELARIMRNISQMDLSASCPDDEHVADSLRYLVSAMHALKRRNPLTESFLVQLDLDFEILAIRIPKLRNAFSQSAADSDNAPGDSRTQPGPVDLGHSVTSQPNKRGYLTTLTGEDVAQSDMRESTEQQHGAQPGGSNNRPRVLSRTHTGTQDSHMYPIPDHLSQSGHDSFHASPVASHQGLVGAGGLGGGVSGFFGETSLVGLAGLGDDGGFGIGSGWDNVQPPSGLEPMGEGVLNALMDIRPMDSMDLGPWDGGTDNVP